MLGRVDTTKYQAGAESISNFIVRPQGALWRRSGTRNCHQTRASELHSHCIDFSFSDVAGYVLEFGNKYAWVYKNRLPVIDNVTGAGVTWRRTNTGVADDGSGRPRITCGNVSAISSVTNNGSGLYRITLAVAYGLRSGSKVLIAGTGTGADGSWTAIHVSTTSFDLAASTVTTTAGAGGTVQSHLLRPGDRVIVANSTACPSINGTWTVHSVPDYATYVLANTSYVAPGGGIFGHSWTRIVEFDTPYLETDIDQIYATQAGDVLYLCHPSYATRKVYRTSDTAWTAATVQFQDGPYLSQNNLAPFVNTTSPQYGTKFPDVSLRLTGYTHTATVYSDTAFAGGGPPSTDQGKYIEWREGDQWRLGLVTSMAPGASTGTVNVIDNVLQYLDEATKVNPKWGWGGISSPVPHAGVRQKFDSNNVLQANGAGASPTKIIANYSGSFNQADVGKFVRWMGITGSATTNKRGWALIDEVAASSNGAQCNLATSVTMVSFQAISAATPAYTGNVTITNEVISATITAYQNGATAGMFASTDVGRLIRLGFGSRFTWGKIASFVNSTQVTVTLYEPMPRDVHNALYLAGNGDNSAVDSGITYDWRLGAF